MGYGRSVNGIFMNGIDIKGVTYGKKTDFILNDPPYGDERCYNALRLANVLGKRDAQ